MDNHFLPMREEQLLSFLPSEDCKEKKLIEAMKYSMAGRIARTMMFE